MRTGIRAGAWLSCLATVLLGLAPVAALADITIDVPVNVTSLPPQVSQLTVACMVCVGPCQSGLAYTPFTGTAARAIDRTLHGFRGRVSVVVPDTVTPADHDHYLCRLELQTPTSFSYPAGTTGPYWSMPAAGTVFVGEVKGALPLCPAGSYADANGVCQQAPASSGSKLDVFTKQRLQHFAPFGPPAAEVPR